MYLRVSCPPLLMPFISNTSPTSHGHVDKHQAHIRQRKAEELDADLSLERLNSAMPSIARLDQPQKRVFGVYRPKLSKTQPRDVIDIRDYEFDAQYLLTNVPNRSHAVPQPTIAEHQPDPPTIAVGHRFDARLGYG